MLTREAYRRVDSWTACPGARNHATKRPRVRDHAGMVRTATRLAIATGLAGASSAVWAASVAAEASFVPGVSPETVGQASVDPTVLGVLVLAVVVLAVALVARSRSGRGAVGIGLSVAAFLFGGLLVLAGLFGDLSGQHQIFVVPLAAGIAVIAGAAYMAWRLSRGPARSASDRPIE